jgi:hypothetical protein
MSVSAWRCEKSRSLSETAAPTKCVCDHAGQTCSRAGHQQAIGIRDRFTQFFGRLPQPLFFRRV